MSSKRTYLARGAVACVPLLLIVLMAFGSTLVSAEAIGGTATLESSSPRVVHGDAVTLSGAVDAQEPCAAGRKVQLRARKQGAESWRVPQTATTGEDGAFGFSARPDHTGRYQAFLPGTDVCERVLTSVVGVEVAARVTTRAGPERVAAGACSELVVRVAPAKPGQQVVVQERGPAGWRPVETLELDAASTGRVPRCYRWADLGVHRLRAVWRPQDELNLLGVTPATRLDVVRAWWMRKIDRLAAGRPTSVALTEDDGEFLYQRADTAPRVPASNEKILMSMSLLDRFGAPFRIATVAAAKDVRGGVVHGRLWIVGGGDPTIDRESIGRLARLVVDAGITRITGAVSGSTGPFAPDWFAEGWEQDFPARYVAFPTALTFEGNRANGVHIRDPERRAAEALTERLRALGVRVGAKPWAGEAPARLQEIARIRSRPLEDLLELTNVESDNFAAEVLGKLLGAARFGQPGTIAKGGAAIAAWAGEHGVRVTAHDGSGLSYANRVTARGLVRLLAAADAEAWGPVLRETLPKPGEGTLERRLGGIELMAKTGTLEDVSTLSGWVRLTRTGEWARFSILTDGYPDGAAKDLEDAIIRVISRHAH